MNTGPLRNSGQYSGGFGCQICHYLLSSLKSVPFSNACAAIRKVYAHYSHVLSRVDQSLLAKLRSGHYIGLTALEWMGVRTHLRPLWLGAPDTGALAPDLSENVGPVPSAACCLFRRPGLSNEAPTRNSFPDEKHRAPPGASKEDLMRPSHAHNTQQRANDPWCRTTSAAEPDKTSGTA